MELVEKACLCCTAVLQTASWRAFNLPAKQDISEILESALSEDTSSSLGYYRAKQSQSGKRKRENPFKPHREKYGIQFPDKSDKCSSSQCEKSRNKKHTISSIMATAPESESQENEQLGMVIRESLRNTPQVSTSLNSAQSVFPIFSSDTGAHT